MSGRLILNGTGFTCEEFFTSYLIDGREFLRIFTFYIIFTDLLATAGKTSAVAGYMRVKLHENSRASIREKLHDCHVKSHLQILIDVLYTRLIVCTAVVLCCFFVY